MHKVVLKGKEAMLVKCSLCREFYEIRVNKHSHPVTLAFNHPRQCIPAKCLSCQKDFTWSPEELISRTVAMELPSFA